MNKKTARDKAVYRDRLSIHAIETSPEILAWLQQFPVPKQAAAKAMLMHLRFVSRDQYSDWVLNTMRSLSEEKKYAVYAVRKLDSSDLVLFGEDGEVIPRPGETLGSEDLVYSLIANISRECSGRFFDHPSVDFIKHNKIRDVVLVDDSIGSGERVQSFINSFIKNKTIASWWSFGWLRFHVISFARTNQGQRRIVEDVRGSNHSFRVFPKKEKIKFVSKIVYSVEWLESRWGRNCQAILDLVDNELNISVFISRGVGAVMGNLVFYHSVPDNIPGVLWSSNESWNGLFLDRAVPGWMLSLLGDEAIKKDDSIWHSAEPSREIVSLLMLIRRGVKYSSGLAMRLNCDVSYAESLLYASRGAGFLCSKNRLTEAGLSVLIRYKGTIPIVRYDRSMYIPKSW